MTQDLKLDTSSVIKSQYDTASSLNQGFSKWEVGVFIIRPEHTLTLSVDVLCRVMSF